MVDLALCERLRAVVQDCLNKHLYTSAAFFADKLVSLSANAGADAGADVFILAETLCFCKQYRRALAVVRRDGWIDLDARFRYLAAKCLSECSEWDECLNVLGDADDTGPAQDGSSQTLSELSMSAALCLLRAQACEALDNKSRAVYWYRQAIQRDPFCYEALSALVDNHMLTNGEELQLVEGLQLGEDSWLQVLYRCKCKKYNQHETIHQDLATLEHPINPHHTHPSPAAAPPSPAPPARPSSHPDRPINQALSFTTPPPTPRHPPDAPPSVTSSADVDMGGQQETPNQEVDSLVGYGLGGNLDVITCRADWYFHSGDYEACYHLTHALLEWDPYAQSVLPVHLAAAVQLGKKNELFLLGHKMVDEYPKSALTWYAVGCYYMCSRQFLHARRFFGKATQLEPSFAPAWLGFGHAFAAQDESDQAMAAYRSAARLFPGLHTPLLGMGMEYLRMNNLSLAERMYLQAHAICPQDPLVCNELGVLAFKHGQWDAAASWLQKALDMVPGGRVTPAWEPTISNLAHAMRKKQQYGEAVRLYERALGLCPGQPGTYAALGYTLHLAGSYSEAIMYYHKALGLRPDDGFSTEMLTLAMEEEGQRTSHQADSNMAL